MTQHQRGQVVVGVEGPPRAAAEEEGRRRRGGWVVRHCCVFWRRALEFEFCGSEQFESKDLALGGCRRISLFAFYRKAPTYLGAAAAPLRQPATAAVLPPPIPPQNPPPHLRTSDMRLTRSSTTRSRGAVRQQVEEEEEEDLSPLLGPFLRHLGQIFEEEVLKRRLNPTDRALFARVGRGCKAAVEASGLGQAGAKTPGAAPFKVKVFVAGSVERLAWAKENGCPWKEGTCGLAAKGGHMEALRWALEHHCPCNATTCGWAATGGQLSVDVVAGEQLPVGRNDLCIRCSEWAPRDVEVGARTPLPVG